MVIALSAMLRLPEIRREAEVAVFDACRDSLASASQFDRTAIDYSPMARNASAELTLLQDPATPRSARTL